MGVSGLYWHIFIILSLSGTLHFHWHGGTADKDKDATEDTTQEEATTEMVYLQWFLSVSQLNDLNVHQAFLNHYLIFFGFMIALT